jgi:hypothetical protein
VPLVLETETSEGELSFRNAAEQFDAGDGGTCTIKVLEAELRPCSGSNPTVVLFDLIVQVFRQSQPNLVFSWHLAHRSVQCSVPSDPLNAPTPIDGKSRERSLISPSGLKPRLKACIFSACQQRGGCSYAKKEQEAHSEEDRPPST